MAKQEYVKTALVTLYDGSKKQIKKRGKTLKEAEDKLKKALWEYENGLLVLNSRSTLSSWAKEWLEVYAKPTMSPSNYKEYETLLRLHILPSLGKVTLDKLLPSQIQRCVNEMSGYSFSYLSKAKIVLSALLGSAKKNKLIRDDLMEGITFPKGQKGERRELTPEERELFMSAIQQHPRGVLFGAMFAMGLRPGEARALMWSDFSDGTVHIQRAIKKGTDVPGPPKTKSGDRIIPVPAWFQEMLDKQPRTSMYVTATSQGLYLPSEKVSLAWRSLKRIMYIEYGVPLYRNRIDENFAKRTSIYELTPYYLRHTYATLLAENGVDMSTAQYLLGHSDITMTANIYTHMNNKRLQEANNVISMIDFMGRPRDNSSIKAAK